MMKPITLLLFFILCISASVVKASSFIIISHSSNQASTISKKDLREIYNGDQVFWPSGKRIRAARLADEQAVSADFLQTIGFKTPTQYVQFWRHKLFSGKGLPPKIVDDSEKMLSYISDTDGSIGYISSELKPASSKIKILEITE